MARELAAAERAAVYGRIGTTTQRVRHDSRAGWSTCSTSLTGNLDRPGGAMFPLRRRTASRTRRRLRPRRAVRPLDSARARAARDLRRAARRRAGRGDRDARRGPDPRADHDRRQPGACRRRTPSGSPRALEGLDFMVSVDVYVNETTRHADVILPGAVAARARRTTTSRCTASRCATSRTDARRCSTRRMPQEWETLLRLTGDRHRPGRRRRHRRDRRLSSRPTWPARAATSSLGRRTPRAGPSGCST